MANSRYFRGQGYLLMALRQNLYILLPCASVAVVPLPASLRHQIDSEKPSRRNFAERLGNSMFSKPPGNDTSIKSSYVGFTFKPSNSFCHIVKPYVILSKIQILFVINLTNRKLPQHPYHLGMGFSCFGSYHGQALHP